MAIKLVTDSTSYIPKELIEKYDIRISSLNIIVNNKSYRELDLDSTDFYKMLEESDDIPKSSQPSLEELTNIFKEIVENGDDIVATFISSKMSGTYSSAHLVRDMILEEYPNAKIEIIDSQTNCMEMGFSVLEGARAASAGKSIKEVVDAIKAVNVRSKFLFAPDTLRYLKKGGRIGGAAALFGSILKIRPILTVVDGETSVFDKVRTQKKAIDIIVNKVLSDVKEKGIGELIVHHINCEEKGRELAKRLSEELNVPVAIQSIGPTIGLHVGPGCMGVAYYTKNK
ncbi:MAG: DegV family protein [Clostridiaceae bacterium]|nr:DegV family protein [Clostridiaceae bacterium]